MRQGSNPNRTARAEKISGLVLACVTHLPNQSGYHEKRLEVVQTCLRTMRDHAGDLPITTLVWDNGSYKGFRNWVEIKYDPDIFIQSPNLGKSFARKSIFAMLPPKTVVAYCDDDIYFEEGWLEPQLDLLMNMPKVSAVTGYPVRTAFRWGTEHTIEQMSEAGGIIEVGRFIPDQWERDFAISIGRDPDFHLNEYTRGDRDYRVTLNERQAYCTAHHCQVVGYAGILSQAAVYDSMAMGDERVFDCNLDRLGARLATIKRYTRHIGNVLDSNLREA
jgi:glycosyltransferase involved in cell wall biosynthesis